MKKYLFYIVLIGLFSCSSSKTIVERPITFNEERKVLTLEYLQNRYGLEQDSPEIDPKMIVLHWTVIPTFEKSFAAFDPVSLPNWRPDIKNVSGLNVSSQFMIDRDGTIYQLMPETTMARHVIGLNHCAIGVENVGGTDDLPLTKAQLKSNIWLVRYLKGKYDIDYLIGHYEYTLFENHPLWLEQDEGYRTKKTDPGKAFMNDVRKAVKDLNFKKLPTNHN
ncbi:MAG TPA: N-acetylmuramoyl-L-alanine amidase [Maribacter sp.]|uniref:N-acetylmuramoyl-L-alanine amidase n=1 Tax=Maribacter TaxID=252356 RepID=UPI000719959F|nr:MULTISPECIES: peptidoglycan recognition family protein [Maribacter]KSA13672.1 N-acetylmuramyl-L-alanine amidase, negative regulator of AmpC, AmpD [Maribacter dokdonensis DSW-8]HAF79068.1 N-acetylmuramoyl-L-alanine amidase [Maribacter sp.]|tara:strand:+ start:27144 stop:27806 length:663 start_codon:yes stop_codon:yes gene_type:complete